MPDSPALKQLSENSQGDVDFLKHRIRLTKWSRGRAGDICREVCHHQVQNGGLPLDEILVWKFTDWVSPMESQVSYSEVSWLVREVPTPSELAWWQCESPRMRKRELGCRRECFVCVAERDGEGVVTVKWMFQHTDEQDEGAEGKSQPEVLLEVGKCKCLYIDSEKLSYWWKVQLRRWGVDQAYPIRGANNRGETLNSQGHPEGGMILLNRWCVVYRQWPELRDLSD